MKDFFISYTRNDRAWAEWIAWVLEEAGFTVVIQAWDFKAGEDFVQRMEEALVETRKLIAVLSQDYFDAKYTNAEWRAAFVKDPSGRERRLLPIRVKECHLPRLLSSRVYVDLLGLTEEDARVAIVRAADESSPRRPESRPAFPGRTHKLLQSKRASRVVKSFPGAASVPPVPASRRDFNPNLGPVVSKCCDRDEQEESFDNAFRDRVKQRCGYPQMYVVHGPVRERHASLVERWCGTLIQDYADHLSGQMKAAITFWEADKWPASGSVATDLSRLIECLFVKCDPKYLFESHAYTPHAFRDLILPLKGRVIVVQHEIDAAKWTPDTVWLIGEYLDFWEAVKADADIPHFLIFINVVYPTSQGGSPWKVWEVLRWVRRARENRQIGHALNRIGEHASRAAAGDDAHCSYKFLEELPCVRLKDVEAWFKKFRIGRNEVAWETQSRNLFRLKGWKFEDGKNMADVEDALDEFVAVMAKSVG